MFKINWNKENNGIILDFSLSKGFKANPRPVFYEELDILGFNKFWKYPKSKKPLLWAIDRKYFYKGEDVAQAKGGNIYEKPEINFTEKGQKLQLEPIDIKKLVKTNEKAIFVLENEAMDFIEKTFKVYRPNVETLRNKTQIKNKKHRISKIDFFVTSFSGGKDSQVLLDIVSRVVPPEHYKVVYSDTGMELLSSIEIYNKTKKQYQKNYPELEFYKEANETSTPEYWKEFGPPSRMHRWCCTVIKTAPFNRILTKIHGKEKPPKILVFEGVRREESNKRATYERIAKGVKHFNMTNARPILLWNISEIWLYLLYRDLPVNESYRKGLTRVGCSVCPFSTGWSEYFINKINPETTEEYLEIIEQQAKNKNISNNNDIKNYIKAGDWKKSAGGKGSINNTSRLDIIKQQPDLKAVITNPKENLTEWLKVVGDIMIDSNGNDTFGEIKVKKQIFKFTAENNKTGKINFNIPKLSQDPILIGKIKKVLYKTTYCVHCESCQVECPTGALTVFPQVKVDTDICTHCANCLTFTDKGCLVAKSKHISEGGKNMSNTKTSGVDKYRTFGLLEKWLKSYLNDLDNWFESETGLGTQQIPGFISWMRDAELIKEKEKQATKLAYLIKNRDINLSWELIWINLYYNSAIVNWYLNENSWNTKLDILGKESEAIEKMKLSFTVSGRTLRNALSSFNKTVSETTSKAINNIAQIEKKGRSYKLITKTPYNEINSISIAYSLYKYAEKTNRYSFTVSELYKENIQGGPYKIFGISKSSFENKLRSLQENPHQIVNVALVSGLDNINLNKDLSSQEVLNILIKK